MQLVKLTASMVMRLIPSVVPEAAAVAPAQPAEAVAVAPILDAAAQLEALLSESHALFGSVIEKVVRDGAAGVAQSGALLAGPAVGIQLNNPPPLASSSIMGQLLPLSELPLESRLLVPSTSVLGAYAHAAPAGPMGNQPASALPGTIGPQPMSTHLRLSASAHKTVTDRASLIHQATTSLIQHTTLPPDSQQGDAAVDAATAALDAALTAMTTYLRGSVPGAGRLAVGGARALGGTGMLSASGAGGASAFGRSTVVGSAVFGKGSVLLGKSYKQKRARPGEIDEDDVREIQAAKRGPGASASAGSAAAASTEAPSAGAVSGAANLLKLLEDAPLLTAAQRAVIEGFARGDNKTEHHPDEKARAAVLAGTSPVESLPKVTYEVGERTVPQSGARVKVVVELDFVNRKWRTVGKKIKA